MPAEPHVSEDAAVHVLLVGERGKSKLGYSFVLCDVYQINVSAFNKPNECCFSVGVNRIGYEHGV